MIWVNTIAIVLLFVALYYARREMTREIDYIHERLLGVLDRELKKTNDDIVFVNNVYGAIDRLEGSYKALHSTTASALNIFEQQILRGAKEDLEVLNGTLEDGEAEEQSIDASAGEVCDGQDQRSECGSEDGSYIGRDIAGDGTDIPCAK